MFHLLNGAETLSRYQCWQHCHYTLHHGILSGHPSYLPRFVGVTYLVPCGIMRKGNICNFKVFCRPLFVVGVTPIRFGAILLFSMYTPIKLPLCTATVQCPHFTGRPVVGSLNTQYISSVIIQRVLSCELSPLCCALSLNIQALETFCFCVLAQQTIFQDLYILLFRDIKNVYPR